MDLSNNIFLNGITGLFDERTKYKNTIIPVLGIKDSYIYIGSSKPFIIDKDYDNVDISGELIACIHGTKFLIKDKNGFYFMDNLGNIVSKYYDKIISITPDVIILANTFYNNNISYQYAIFNEYNLIWENTYLPDEIFYDSGYYILSDYINTKKIKDTKVSILYDYFNNPIKSSLTDDLENYYKSIKPNNNFNILDSREILEEYIRRSLIKLGLGSNLDSLVDIIINANAKNILLIVSLEDFSIKVLEESSKRDELEANNYLYVNKLRRVK